MLIGLAGFARVGKDTVGAILVEEYGFRRYAFADVMKEAVAALDPIIDVDWHGHATVYLGDWLRPGVGGWEQAKTLPEVRRLLQRFGTEMGREVFGEDFWVEQTFKRIPGEVDVVLTDVRFPNEAEAIKAQGGVVWRVVRTGVGAPNDHPSEHALEGFAYDELVSNDGSLGDLSRVVREHLAAAVVA